MNTRILEQSIMLVLVNGGIDITNKNLLQKAVIELKPKDFTALADQDLFKLVANKIKSDSIYYSFELMSDTQHQDVIARIEYYIKLADNGVFFTGFEDNILKLKRFNALKNRVVYLDNINKSLNSVTDIDELEALFFDNLNAINNFENISSSKQTDLHTLIALNASNELESVVHYQTTFKKLNESLEHKGIRAGTLCIVAGASGVGKSSFSLFLLDSIASLQPEKQSLFFSLELDKIELMERYLGVLIKKPYSQMTKSNIEKATLAAIERPNIKVFDLLDYPDIKYVHNIIRHSILSSYSKPISVIVIDFIGLVKIEGYRESKAQMLEDIAYQLLSLSKKLGCIIILLQQVNRDYYKRETHDIVPIASDASDSSGPEKASSIWIGIGRHTEQSGHDPNHFELVCRKNRHGLMNFRISLEFANGTFRELSPHFQFRRPVKRDDENILNVL
jgi:replicative DNA helicase